MTIEKQISQLRLAAEIIEKGLEWQFKGGKCFKRGANDILFYLSNYYEIRVKPETKLVPWTNETRPKRFITRCKDDLRLITAWDEHNKFSIENYIEFCDILEWSECVNGPWQPCGMWEEEE
jgi:hypothetical protein